MSGPDQIVYCCGSDEFTEPLLLLVEDEKTSVDEGWELLSEGNSLRLSIGE